MEQKENLIETKKESPLVFSYVAEQRRGHKYISFPKGEPLDLEWIESIVKKVKKTQLRPSNKLIGIVLAISLKKGEKLGI
jgi:hypothetical protein